MCVCVCVCVCVYLGKRVRGSVMGYSSEAGGDDCVFSKFHFVDLAGSERVSKTGNRGERFKGQ